MCFVRTMADLPQQLVRGGQHGSSGSGSCGSGSSSIGSSGSSSPRAPLRSPLDFIEFMTNVEQMPVAAMVSSFLGPIPVKLPSEADAFAAVLPRFAIKLDYENPGGASE